MNIDIVLFAGRIVLVALLYIFLFAVMKTGVGLVRGQRRDSAIWTIDVDKGPRGIRGIHVDMLGPVIVGRSPSSDICINEPFVSASHARFSLQGPALIIEDLNSLNGTLVNGAPVTGAEASHRFTANDTPASLATFAVVSVPSGTATITAVPADTDIEYSNASMTVWRIGATM